MPLSEDLRNELALNSFDRAVAADPGFAEAWFNRALHLLALGRRTHAIESCPGVIPRARAKACSALTTASFCSR